MAMHYDQYDKQYGRHLVTRRSGFLSNFEYKFPDFSKPFPDFLLDFFQT